ncbi:MAG: 5,10-methylenetetrahydrofolate reductase [Acidobacteria bacterium]|nr:MAG: 5,10-methylenetetrahydrofolate reductase [Acidobacteriota bacterium]
MKMTNVLSKAKNPVLSLEITPPDRGRSVDELFSAIEGLMDFAPKFISVTYHQPHTVYEEVNGIIRRRPKRKKPGTVGISAAIKNRYGVTTIPHLICGGFDRFETEDALIDLHYLGMKNILALRGDPAPGHTRFVAEKDGHHYASELVTQIAAMNRGEYLDELDNAVSTDFCIGVAGYPEKHAEAPNLEKDLAFLKQKVDAGADFIITQMFFGFDYFCHFVEKAREIGITIPIIPGIKPVTNRRQIEQIPRLFFATMPQELVKAVEGAKTPAEAFNGGTRYMAKLVQQLLDFGVPGIHLFIQEKSDDSHALLSAVYGS